MTTRRRARVGLRLRLLAGSGMLAVLAALAALLAAYGAAQSARQIDAASSAEARIELFGALSGRVGDYAIVAVEQAGAPSLDADERAARIGSRAAQVRAAFDRLESALAGAVADARALGVDEQAERATRGLGLARMRALFEALDRAVAAVVAEGRGNAGGDAEVGAATLRAELNSFATRFSPLLSQAIDEERRTRDAAFAAAERLRLGLALASAGVIAFAVLAVVLFHVGITRPLVMRLGAASEAAAAIGRGGFATRLAGRGHDELGLLFAQLNRAAARLGRDRAAIDADRARLEEIVAERTHELSEANARLEAADAERRRFVADIGHELRTPLTVILAETELNLASEAEDASEARASFATIRARARRLNRRIDDILRIARSESGQIDLESESFDLAAAASEAVDDVEGLARRAGVRIEVNAQPAVVARGDRDWTRQVVAGLLDNAIRHSPRSGRVRVTVAPAGEASVAVAVIDEGPGITAQDKELIFGRFARGGAGRGENGSGTGFGVGLALARWIAERQSGTIEAMSPAPEPVGPGARGPGAAFRLVLPVPGTSGGAVGGDAGENGA
ncbi:HAMP domain-containing histidine kinase [Limibaculum sp. M0105]|uniref:histidine kinase n=1 Tax=Thermohalobaculum xanthum TaxID=2753746 RepID=A0A8J7M785_9RHOB|nr:HAMP domain-containing sensor histidine kinase [Thermohalobaculum xanthum]MBK0399881.1 HAMP domain-containing histidine kinase [Thermohalobaculum xanthum]